MPKTTVSKYEYVDDSGAERVQFSTTVPKQVAELLDLDGAVLEWEAKSRNRIELTIDRNPDEGGGDA